MLKDVQLQEVATETKRLIDNLFTATMGKQSTTIAEELFDSYYARMIESPKTELSIYEQAIIDARILEAATKADVKKDKIIGFYNILENYALELSDILIRNGTVPDEKNSVLTKGKMRHLLTEALFSIVRMSESEDSQRAAVLETQELLFKAIMTGKEAMVDKYFADLEEVEQFFMVILISIKEHSFLLESNRSLAQLSALSEEIDELNKQVVQVFVKHAKTK